VERRVCLYWGVEPRGLPLTGDIDSIIEHAAGLLLAERKIRPGDTIAAVAGSPFGTPGSANLLKLVKV
jgi:pyruvate kinase